MRQPFNLATTPAVLRTTNLLALDADYTRQDVWSAAQELTLFIASYAREKHLPPDVVGVFFGLLRPFVSYEEAALHSAQAIVNAFYALEEEEVLPC